MRKLFLILSLVLSCVLAQSAAVNWTNRVANIQAETNGYFGRSVNIGAGFADAWLYPDSGPAVTPFRLQSSAIRLSGNIFEVSNGPGFLTMSSGYDGLLSAPDLLLTGDASVQGGVLADHIVVTNGIIASNLTASVNGLINVKSAPYNAVGNGSTDDTTAFQNALNAGSIEIPEGSYVLQSLTIPTGRTVIGRGKPPTLIFLPTSTGFLLDGQTNSNIQIENLELNGTNNTTFKAVTSAGSRSGIRMNTYGTNTLVRNVFAHGFDAYGILLAGWTNSASQIDVGRMNAKVLSCNLQDCWAGLYVTNAFSEYTMASAIRAYNCYHGIYFGDGNFALNQVEAIENNAGIYVMGTGNDSHSVINGSLLNHNVYPLICNHLSYGLSVDNCAMFGGSIWITNSSGVNIRHCIVNVDNYLLSQSSSSSFDDNYVPAVNFTNNVQHIYGGVADEVTFHNNLGSSRAPLLGSTMREACMFIGNTRQQISNTVSAVSFIPTGTGYTNFPVSFFMTGRQMRFKASGVIYTTNTPSLTLNMQLYTGTFTYVLANTGAMAMGSLTNHMWDLEGTVTVSGSNLMPDAKLWIDNPTHVGSQIGMPSVPVAINKNLAMALQCTATWDTADPVNMFICDHFTIFVDH